MKCPPTLRLIEKNLGSWQKRTAPVYFPGDDLFSPFKRRCGLPLGNQTSQFFGNLYLNGFDHHVKEQLKCRYYIRYVDDFVIFENSKQKLGVVLRAVKSILNTLRLSIHQNKTRIYRVKEAPLFLGFRTYPTHRRLDRRNVIAMRKRMKMMQRAYKHGTMTAAENQHRIRSWIGHACHADTFHLREMVISSIPFVRGDFPNGQGGTWNNNEDNMACRARNQNHPNNRNNNAGFRIVRTGA